MMHPLHDVHSNSSINKDYKCRTIMDIYIYILREHFKSPFKLYGESDDNNQIRDSGN